MNSPLDSLPGLQSRYNKFRDEEFAAIYQRWKHQTFSAGPIARGTITDATAGLVSELYRPEFERSLREAPGRATKNGPRNDWWAGLKALSRVLGTRFSDGIGSHLKDGEKVDAETWLRKFHANARATVGKGEKNWAFPADWTEDKIFIDAWAKAIESVKGDQRHAAMYILARGWDTFPLPLRFFSDSAALQIVNLFLRLAGYNPVELDTYRKDIRGNRSGLQLIPPRHGDAVATWSRMKPNTVRLHRDLARRNNLDLKNFPPSSWAPDLKDRLEFVG
jgi:hypothetical protein